MSTLVSFVAEVEEAIASKDPIRRVDSLRRMTNLFVEQEQQLGEAQLEIFDEVILRLSRDLERRARQELSERLSEIERAPRKVVRSLAFDPDSDIARPVLERSSRLDEEDLVMIARARGQDHLLAISKRSNLSERVTDVLVNRGNEVVVRSVAGNGGARFSASGLAEMVAKARQDTALQSLLQARRDLPPQHMAQLVDIAREKVRETLESEYGEGSAAELSAALEEAANALARTGGSGLLTGNFERAARVVEERAAGRDLVEHDVIGWVRDGQIDEALAALAHLASVPVAVVARAYQSQHYDPLLFIIRSVRFGWGTFKLFLTARDGRPPSSEVLRGAFEAFQQLSVQTAQRVVRFTAARERATQPDVA
jgi:uncharacterized protein (DUF2336 family)